MQPVAPTISNKVLNRLGIPLENRFFDDALDSFSALDGEQFERVGRLLGPVQGHVYKKSELVNKEKQELIRYRKIIAFQLPSSENSFSVFEP